jgi:apolipoprotein N-acyltransferase
MNTSTIDHGQRTARIARGVARADRLRYLWWASGTVMSLFAVGGRWDLPFVAWLYPIFLLRFSRTSRPALAVALVWLASIAAGLFWSWQLVVPVQASTMIGCVVLATVFTLPYLLDRLLWPRLRLLGGLLLFPAARAACEYGMGAFSPLGTAYGLSAVTQFDNLALLQVTSITGPYAIGFLIGWLATTVNWAWANPFELPRLRRIVGAYAAILFVVILAGGARLAFFPPTTDSVRIAAIAPNGATEPNVAVLDELFATSRVAANAGAKVVIWSENAAVLSTPDETGFLDKAAAVAREEQIYLNVADNLPRVHDETHLLGPGGDVLWSYRKARPIPGLEVYAPGDGKVPVVQTPHGRLANVICYDADFPALVRADADIMLVPGGDWPQMGRVHTLKMASLRAIEQGYSLVRADFNGVSAAFDHQGHVLAMLDTTGAGRHLMIVDVPVRGTTTLYRLIGDVFAWLCVAGVVLGIGKGVLRPRGEGSAH